MTVDADQKRYDKISMPHKRYVRALERLRVLVESGRKLHEIDSDVVGDKHTSCSWGLCADDKESWPDAEDHLWPDQFRENGRVAPKYLRQDKGQFCPLDSRAGRRLTELQEMQGCFYTCRIFQATKSDSAPGRAETIALYDAQISRAEIFDVASRKGT